MHTSELFIIPLISPRIYESSDSQETLGYETKYRYLSKETSILNPLGGKKRNANNVEAYIFVIFVFIADRKAHAV